MTQYHEGQEVEVYDLPRGAKPHGVYWRRAKIVARASDAPVTRTRQWAVQFLDGSRAVFDAEHIRVGP